LASTTVTLEPHPTSAGSFVRSLRATVSRPAEGMLAVVYTLEGALDALRIPLTRPANVSDRLWEHTCFELFIARPGGAAYHELNFAPYGAWAVYAFDRYRVRSRDVAPAIEPSIHLRHADTKLELEAQVELARLSREYASGSLALGVSAVIEDTEGNLSYWSIAHPQPKPDFHDREAFTLAL